MFVYQSVQRFFHIDLHLTAR